MAQKDIKSDISVEGQIKLTNVPNATGTLLTYNTSSGAISTRTNAQIISDLALNTDLTAYVKKTGDTMSGALTFSGFFAGRIVKDLSTLTGGFSRNIFELTGTNGLQDSLGYFGNNDTSGNTTLNYGYIGGTAYNTKSAVRWTPDGRVGIGLTSTSVPNTGYALHVSGNTYTFGNADVTGNINSNAGELVVQRLGVNRIRTGGANGDSLILSGEGTSAAIYLRPQGDAITTGQVYINSSGNVITSSYGTSEQWNLGYQAYGWGNHAGKYFPRTSSVGTPLDLNTLTLEGVYYGYQWTNSPSTNSIASVTVKRYSNDWIRQEYNVINGTGNTYVRDRYNGTTWGDWKIIADREWVASSYSLSTHTHTFASLTSKPTTLSGYGITDAYNRDYIISKNINGVVTTLDAELPNGGFISSYSSAFWGGSDRPTGASYGGYIKFKSQGSAGFPADLDLYYNNGHGGADLHRLWFRTKNTTVGVTNWFEFATREWTTLQLSNYVTQSSLTGYAKLTDSQTFTGNNTFSQSPIIPDGTLIYHAVSLGQMTDNIDQNNSAILNYVTNNFIPNTHVVNGITSTNITNWNNAFNFTSNFTTNYNDLVAIEALSGTDGYLRKDGNGQWSLTQSPIGDATSTTGGRVKLFSDAVQTVASNAVSATAGRTYGVQFNSSGQMVVNIPWVDTNTSYTAGNGLTLTGTVFSLPITVSGSGNYITDVTQNTNGITVTKATLPGYTLPVATSTSLGGVRLITDTQNNVAPNAISTTVGRSYAVQINNNNQMVVNIPWVNDNTTYSNGTGLSLTGTTFSVNYGTTAGTSAQGNDSRINNGQTAFTWGNHASAGYVKPDSNGFIRADGFVNPNYDDPDYVHTTDGGVRHVSDFGGTLVRYREVNPADSFTPSTDSTHWNVFARGGIKVYLDSGIHTQGQKITIYANGASGSTEIWSDGTLRTTITGAKTVEFILTTLGWQMTEIGTSNFI